MLWELNKSIVRGSNVKLFMSMKMKIRKTKIKLVKVGEALEESVKA